MEATGESKKCARLIELIKQDEARIARAQAQQLDRIAELAKLEGRGRGVNAEVAFALRLTENAAAKRVSLACALTTQLPETLKAMRRGEIDSYKASKMSGPAEVLTDEQAREVDLIMSTRWSDKNPSSIRRAVNRIIAQVDKDGYERRCRARRACRNLTLIPRDEGMVSLHAELPSERGIAVYNSINSEARTRRSKNDPRTLDQLRADIFAERCLGDSPARKGVRADIFVYVDLTTLAGLKEEPAEVAGYGPIPASLAREIAFSKDATWRRIVTDPVSGLPVDVGRKKYRPPAPLDRFIRIRDRECRAPGCSRPAQLGALDHVKDWAKGGRTDLVNLGGYCDNHHGLKDEPGWKFEIDASGTVTITAPSGSVYVTKPEPFHDPR